MDFLDSGRWSATEKTIAEIAFSSVISVYFYVGDLERILSV